jgi:CRP-like cAMP-binding protein
MDRDHLRTLPLFSSLSDKALDAVSALASETSVSAGELIVREGEYRYTVSVIETGTADVVKAGEIIASLGPGDVFGEMAILSGRERTADVVATSSMRLVTLRKPHLEPVANEVSEQLQALVDERRGRQDEQPQTPDLVELVRQLTDAVNRRDFDAVEASYAPDAVFRGAEAGTFEGAAAIRDLFEGIANPHEEFHAEAEEITDLGNGVTFCVLTLAGRPVGSSGEVRFRFASVAIWTNGVIERDTRDINIDEARAAAERLAEERG